MKVIVIGGGAAGMMAAYSSAAGGNETWLIEKNEKLGKKIYITGKGRCNLTNCCPEEDFLRSVVTNQKFMYSSIYALNPMMTMDLFGSFGLRLKTERGNRVFPESDRASDVTKALEKKLRELGVHILLNTSVLKVEEENKVFKSILTDKKGRIEGDACIVATGGLSYPSTGSTGDGYEFARKLGHSLTDFYPSLVGLKTREKYVREMEGLSLKNVQLTVYRGDKQLYKDQGELLFTHNGVSGPLILTVSSLFAKNIVSERGVLLVIDLKPALSAEKLDERMVRDLTNESNKAVKNVLGRLLPSSMIPVILSLGGIDGDKKANLVSQSERKKLLDLIKGFKLEVERSGDFSEAVITKGGINVKEINPRTMESRLISGIFFAGEVLDVDALTGGYNLQIAWSTGYMAGKMCAQVQGKEPGHLVKKQKKERCMKAVSIAIDGPAGAGKSTIAKRIAKELGYIYIDTGAMYRAIGYCLLQKGIDLNDEERVSKECRDIDLKIKYVEGMQHVIVGDDDVTGFIRTDEVGASASKISAYSEVRKILVAMQQKLAEKENVVMDGRDIGSVVLPKAEVKIYLTASVEERARRRFEEYSQKGQPCDLEKIKKEIEERDYRDMTRENSPLVCVPDAHIIDSSDKNIDEVCKEVYGLVNRL